MKVADLTIQIKACDEEARKALGALSNDERATIDHMIESRLMKKLERDIRGHFIAGCFPAKLPLVIYPSLQDEIAMIGQRWAALRSRALDEMVSLPGKIALINEALREIQADQRCLGFFGREE
jgi:hypothetical protein